MDSIIPFLGETKRREHNIEICFATTSRWQSYEKDALLEDVVLIDLKDQKGFIAPLNDTWWNFHRFHKFMREVLKACQTPPPVAGP